MAIQLIVGSKYEVLLGPFLDETDGITPLTSLTIANTDIKIWKQGSSALVNKNSGGATHMANGIYYCTMNDTDLSSYDGPLVAFVHKSGALPVKAECYVEEGEAYYRKINYWRSLLMVSATGTPTTTTVPLSPGYPAAALSSTNNEYVGLIIYRVLAGAGSTAGAASRITAYNGTTKTITVDPPFPTAPSSGQYFMMIPASPQAVLADGSITAAKIATDAITAAKVASDAVTEIQSGLATASALSTVAGYIDTEVAAILADTNELQTDWVNGGRLDLLIDAIKAKTDTIPASPAAVGSAMTLATGAITAAVIATGAIDADSLAADAVDEIIDEVIEGSTTMRQALRVMLAVAAGKSSGGGTTTVKFRDIADSKDRITATVDANGNRTAVTRDSS